MSSNPVQGMKLQRQAIAWLLALFIALGQDVLSLIGKEIAFVQSPFGSEEICSFADSHGSGGQTNQSHKCCWWLHGHDGFILPSLVSVRQSSQIAFLKFSLPEVYVLAFLDQASFYHSRAPPLL